MIWFLLTGPASAETVDVVDPTALVTEVARLWGLPGEHVVRMGPGDWTERLTLDTVPAATRLVFAPLDPADPPRWRSDSAEGVARIRHGEVVFDRLVLVGGTGRALRVLDDAVVTLDRTAILGGTTTGSGGCIEVLQQGSLSVVGAFLSGCRADVSGGAIAFGASGRLSIEHSVISGSHAGGQGGGVLVSAGTATLLQTVVMDNVALGSGGGLSHSSEVLVRRSRFVDNRAGTSGGGWFTGAPGIAWSEGNQFVGNQADDGGGWFSSGLANSLGDGFLHNRALVVGGGVHAFAGTFDVVDARFCWNTSEGAGGGLGQDGAVASLSTSVFMGNQADGSGGGLWARTLVGDHVTLVRNSATGTGSAGRFPDTGGLSGSLVIGTPAHVSGGLGAVDSYVGTAGAAGMEPSACSFAAVQPPCTSPAATTLAADGLPVGAMATCLGADHDGDGSSQPADCDDTDATVLPGAIEVCGDDRDQDCDGVAVRGFVDVDVDGYGSDEALGACAVASVVPRGGDCDDAEPLAFPGGIEVCDGVDNDCDGVLPTDELDGDRDGRVCADDCDDTHPGVYVGAPEVCDGIDNDCDTVAQDDAPGLLYLDVDGDGFGDQLAPPGCSPGASPVAGDCADDDPTRHPAVVEICGNTVDDNCDGVTDAGPADGPVVAYEDVDGDGIGAGPAVRLCALEPGFARVDGDCDDADPERTPGRVEVCDGVDNDCDGQIDPIGYPDLDGDGYGDPEGAVVCPAPGDGWVADGTDCDDTDASVHPGAADICDGGVDNDCSPLTPDGPVVPRAPDLDADGFGSDATVLDCLLRLDHTSILGDCDDAEPTVNPLGTELCNAIDDDCDGEVDDAFSLRFWFFDGDADGFGGADGLSACAELVDPGLTDLEGDCDDAQPLAYPGRVEVCDGIDNDCDDEVDEDLGAVFYVDTDGDGFGDAPVRACDGIQPPGTSPVGGDCDDADVTAFPGAVEACDGVDTDCDGDLDNDVPGANTFVVFPDGDGDGSGDGLDARRLCVGQAVPAGFTLDELDCDDADAEVGPFATERCNGVDDDCDGLVDDAPVDGEVLFVDADDDGFGSQVQELFCGPGPGRSDVGTDCDDTEPLVYPGRPELCDGVDDDCGGDLDAGPIALGEGTLWYADADGDGVGVAPAVARCLPLPGETELDGDCDDADAEAYPGAPEACDGKDNNCDPARLIDEGTDNSTAWFRDDDGDTWGAGPPTLGCNAPDLGWVSRDGDCNDNEAAVRPGQLELCGGVDEDCDPTTTVGADAPALYRDLDGDLYGDGASERRCPESGWVSRDGDCDDGSPLISPDAAELCSAGIDENCDGSPTNDAIDPDMQFRDLDGDGFGGPGEFFGCGLTMGFVEVAGDCDDLDPAISPVAEEVCNDRDDDCDGDIDVGAIDASTFWADVDGDGFGDADAVVLSCVDLPDHVRCDLADACEDDCDDASSVVNPGADEVCNDLDDDCDTVVDQDAIDRLTVYLDDDADGFAGATGIEVCDPDGRPLAPGTDCDDARADVNPGEIEVCTDPDGLDEDCDGVANAADAACADAFAPPPSTGCRCTTTPSPAGGGAWVLLGLLGLAARRRVAA